MNDISIYLAVEDQLSEVIARKIINESERSFEIAQCLRRSGYGYLKSKVKAFNKAASGIPFFLLTDLDNPKLCPAQKINNWLAAPKHTDFLFRVAVMEVESWLLADREASADFLGVPINKIPLETDKIFDPKIFLINLACNSRSRALRAELVPSVGATSKQGPNYNPRLSSFIEEHWNPRHAGDNSESLRRTLHRLKKFDPAL